MPFQRNGHTAAGCAAKRQGVLLRVLVAFVIVAIGLVTLGLPAVSEASSGQTFKVWVGYFGGPYYEKASYTASELENLMEETNGGELVEYSSMDKSGYLRKGFAQGIYLSDLLDTVGIDSTDVTSFYFDTEDSYRADDEANPVRQWSRKNLLGTTRYYYPDMYKYYDYLDSEIPSKNVSKINKTKVRVGAMLALKSSFQKVGGSSQTQEDGVKAAEAIWNDSSQITSALGNRIMFGQTSVEDHTAGYSAHSIRSLKVTYEGYPTISLSQGTISGKVGDTVTVAAKITSADSLISAKAIEDLEWSVDDKSVAKVESVSDGQVTLKIVGEGETNLTVSLGESGLDGATSASAGVAGSKAKEEKKEKKTEKKEKGTGGGSGGGKGSGSGKGSGEGTGSDKGKGGTSDSGSKANSDDTNTSGLSGTDKAVEITAGSDAGGGESEKGKAVEVESVDTDEEATPFVNAYELNPVVEDPTIQVVTGYAAEIVGGASAALVVGGAVSHVLIRRRQTRPLTVDKEDSAADVAAA